MHLPVPVVGVSALNCHQPLILSGVDEASDFLLCVHLRLILVLLFGDLLTAELPPVRLTLRLRNFIAAILLLAALELFLLFSLLYELALLSSKLDLFHNDQDGHEAKGA